MNKCYESNYSYKNYQNNNYFFKIDKYHILFEFIGV